MDAPAPVDIIRAASSDSQGFAESEQMPYTLSQAASDTLPPEFDQDEAAGVPGGEENRWTLNFGPQHPATHTTLRIVLELDGERIVGCTPHIGYLHSGFEKLGEHLNYNQYVTIVDRMDYSAPIYNELAWHGAAEKLMAIELTPVARELSPIATAAVLVAWALVPIATDDVPLAVLRTP